MIFNRIFLILCYNYKIITKGRFLSITETIKSLLQERILVIDGAMGTQIQDLKVPFEAWLDDKGVAQEGCNEL